jgi:hypothetical protein
MRQGTAFQRSIRYRLSQAPIGSSFRSVLIPLQAGAQSADKRPGSLAQQRLSPEGSREARMRKRSSTAFFAASAAFSRLSGGRPVVIRARASRSPPWRLLFSPAALEPTPLAPRAVTAGRAFPGPRRLRKKRPSLLGAGHCYSEKIPSDFRRVTTHRALFRRGIGFAGKVASRGLLLSYATHGSLRTSLWRVPALHELIPVT